MTPEILFERSGPLALATLNRPESLNALTLEMIRAYGRALAEWRDDPGVAAVVLRGGGGRAFCAGGDVRSVCRARGEGDVGFTAGFFREEYAVDLAVARFPKPHVALWDGVVMGGGVGLSLYGSHRVATERTLLAMPETALGFFCDVGATWFLPRLPGRMGLYLGLTGARVGPGDALALGLATHFVPAAALPSAVGVLAKEVGRAGGGPAVDRAFAPFAADPGPAPLLARREVVDRCFSADSVEEILARLEAENTAWARNTFRTLEQRSPTSLKVVHRSLAVGSGLDLEGALEMEYRLSQRFVASHDFCEGVRALLEDRDGSARWDPSTLSGVDGAWVSTWFEGDPRGAAPEKICPP